MHGLMGLCSGCWVVCLAGAVPRAAAQLTCPGSDAVLLDCNGNATDDYCDIAHFFTSLDQDSDSIPDECAGEACFDGWAGFEPVPPFAVGTFIHGIDYDGDGSAWDNPSNSWSIVNQGCPSNQGKALKGVAQVPPLVDEYLRSEFFHTGPGGALECRASRYHFSADLRAEAQLNPRIDWQIMLRDEVTGSNVVLLHLASTQSSFVGVTTAQGGNGRGRLLIQNPAGSPAFINTGHVLAANQCFNIEVELDNTAPEESAVRVSVNGTLRATIARLSPIAARMDYLFVQQVANNQAAGGINRLALDNVMVCEAGRAVGWPDCNLNCVADFEDIAGGSSADCNSNAVPDECESSEDCNTNAVADICDIASGASDDCDANGVPNECDPDCNGNAIPDGCDIAAGTSADCNANGRLDICDVTSDYNDDGALDLQDWIALATRLHGPQAPASCPLFDLDGDGDIDLVDVASFQAIFTGPDSDGDRIPDLYETDDGVYLSPTATGTDPTRPDTDLDGLLDGDEVLGTLAGLDLPGMGASPLRRDIFVEVDWTDDGFDIGPHSHRPTPAIASAISDAFATAPVANPYGLPDGVSLHVDYGQGGLFTGGNPIPGGPAFIVFGSGFNNLKAIHFAANRKGYFHYAIFTHRYNNSGNNSSGVAEIAGDDFMVTLPFSPQDTSAVSKTMMHELGHNLNLRHGGNENLNQKPNYNSVMNYRYQFSGIDTNCNAFGDGVPDYSSGLLATIDENNLNECNGICGPGFAIDWNFSGGPCQTSIAQDITVGEDGNPDLDVLRDFDDWSSLAFATLQGGDRAEPEIVTCQDPPLP